MDAWNNLIAGSTIPVQPGNDAWDHLLAQGGGSGPGGVLTLYEGIEVMVGEDTIEAILEDSHLAVEVVEDQSVEANLDNIEIIVEIEDPETEGEI